MYFLYSALLAVCLIVGAPLWLLAMLRYRKFRAGFAERLGFVPRRLQPAKSVIWIHAVSVGEALAIAPLVERVRREFPTYDVVISTTTATGQKLARQRFGENNVFYFPLDFGFAVSAYLRRLRPELLVMAETEFWPNALRLTRKSGVRIAVVNARISDRSFPRYRRARALLRHVLENVSVFLAQTEDDARRLREIGAHPERVRVSGNLKFDHESAVAAPILEPLRSALAGSGPIIVCGSTVEGEEPIMLAAFHKVQERYPRAALILAPRHPERFDAVAALITESGSTFHRRSQWNGEAIDGVFLLDSIGELASVYRLATIAVVAGSLVPRGGHNILEAAQAGAAVIVGPHTGNFRDMIARFRQADALREARPEELAETMLALLDNAGERAAMVARATAVLEENTGATERTLTALRQLLERQSSTEMASAGERR